MATIKDVARAAGVSLGTVSNVLNGKESVKQESRERVRQAIRELGFQYNMTASALRTRATKNVGLVIPTIVNPYYPELARGTEDAVRKAGCTLFLCNSDRELDKERQYVNALLSRGADGLILVKTGLGEDELRQLSEKISLVLVDYQEKREKGFYIVNVNDTAGIRQGMCLLRQKGHERIAFISGQIDSYSSECRIEAYKNCLSEWGIQYRPGYVAMGDYSWNSGYVSARKFMALDEPPTAIFASNDIMAIGVIKAAVEMGIRIPEQLSVIGYDDIEMSNLCAPALTTIHQPKYQIGVEAARLLISSREKDGADEMYIQLETRLVSRKSVGNAPAV